MGYEEIEEEVDTTLRRWSIVSKFLPAIIAKRYIDIEWAREMNDRRDETVETYTECTATLDAVFDDIIRYAEQIMESDEFDEETRDALVSTLEQAWECTGSLQQLEDKFLKSGESTEIQSVLEKAGTYTLVGEQVLRTAETREIEIKLAGELKTVLEDIEGDLTSYTEDKKPAEYSLETISDFRHRLDRVNERIEQFVVEVESESAYETLQDIQSVAEVDLDEFAVDLSQIERPEAQAGLRERCKSLTHRLDTIELEHRLVVGHDTLDSIESGFAEMYETIGDVPANRERVAQQLDDIEMTLERIRDLSDRDHVPRPAVDDIEVRYENLSGTFDSEAPFAETIIDCDNAIGSLQETYNMYTEEGSPTEYIMVSDRHELLASLSQAERFHEQAERLITETDRQREGTLRAAVKTRAAELDDYRHQFQNHNTEYAQSVAEKYPELFVDQAGNELNARQKEAVIANDRRILVPAAAGTGKTKTVVHKIEYLINVKQIPAERILTAGFSNASVEELDSRITVPGIETTTIHSLANRIINTIEPGRQAQKDIEGIVPELLDELMDPDSMYYDPEFEQEYLRLAKHMADSDQMEVTQIDDGDETDTEPPGHQHVEYFLDRHKIEYSENELVPEVEEAPGSGDYRADFYLDNYDIVISHIPVVDAPPSDAVDDSTTLEMLMTLDESSAEPAIHENAEASFRQLKRTVEYEQQRFDELEQIDLMYTHEWEYINGSLQDALERRLVERFVVPVTTDKQTYIEDKNRAFEKDELDAYILEKLSEGVEMARSRAIPSGRGEDQGTIVLETQQGTTGQTISDLYPNSSPLYQSFRNVLGRLYAEYPAFLRDRGYSDYREMTARATELLIEHPDHKEIQQFTFDYLILDEFQDISSSDLDFVMALLKITDDAQLFCVGDDWQSIYAFRGGTSYYFMEFEELFDYPTNIITLNKTYRNPQTVVDASIRLIENNEKQRSKDIEAATKDSGAITIHKSSMYSNRMAEDVADLVGEYIGDSWTDDSAVTPSDIKIIVKTKFAKEDIKSALAAQGFKSVYNPDSVQSGKVTIETAHSSKGTAAQHVIIYRALDDEPSSFPNIHQKSNILDPLTPEADNTYQEERRLFYVALTRTKRTLDIFTSRSGNKQSRFIRELKADFQQTPSQTEGDLSRSALERLLEHGIWDGETPILAETALTGDAALSLVEHAHEQTDTGLPLFQLFASIVTADAVDELSRGELVQFYHWYVEQTDEYFYETDLADVSVQSALEPFVELVTIYNQAISTVFTHCYQSAPITELLDVLDTINNQALIDRPTKPNEFDEVVEQYVFEAGSENQDCSTVTTILEQTASGMIGREQESKRVMKSVNYLKTVERLHEDLQIPYPFRQSNDLQWLIRDLESVGARLLDSDELMLLRTLKQWSSDSAQFNIIAAASQDAVDTQNDKVPVSQD